MSIWFIKPTPSLELVNRFSQNRPTVHDVLDIQVTGITDDSLTLSMPVDQRHVQPLGLLHGGVSVVLAESAASLAASLCLDHTRQYAVGIEINANHIKSVKQDQGAVHATASPIHIGGTSHVWRIIIENDAGRQICESRMTARVLDHRR